MKKIKISLTTSIEFEFSDYATKNFFEEFAKEYASSASKLIQNELDTDDIEYKWEEV